jgi:hypothetical protein
MRNLVRKIELLANVSIIIVAILLCSVLIKGYLLTDSPAPTPLSTTPESPVHIGAKVALPDMDWQKNGSTLLLALSTTCHFCTDSAPFYQRVVKERGDTKIVALLPQTTDEGKAYLKSLDVSVDDVKQVALETLGVRGTPTLILVDQDGKVKNVWIGILTNQRENELLSQLHLVHAHR